jgi:protein-S-isoprenylcysteine O-methyltransferase Ste14
MFTLMVTGLNFVFSWLRVQSGSFWPAAVLHASHNLFVQSIFTPLTLQNHVTPYIIDEFGVGLALAGLVLAVIFFEKKKAHSREPLAVGE